MGLFGYGNTTRRDWASGGSDRRGFGNGEAVRQTGARRWRGSQAGGDSATRGRGDERSTRDEGKGITGKQGKQAKLR